jgi:hypothetical protein
MNYYIEILKPKSNKKYFLGSSKDIKNVAVEYTNENELVKNNTGTKVNLYTKEQAEERKKFMDEYTPYLKTNIKELSPKLQTILKSK